MTIDERADGPAGADPAADPALRIPEYLLRLWRGGGQNRPGPKPGFDLRSIAAAGIAIADSAGLAAVSMRSVASALGVTTMALYRYVRSKDELLSIMADEAYGPPQLCFQPDWDWRRRMVEWAKADQAALIAHPWILQIPVTEPPLTPNTNGWTDLGLGTLAGTGLTWQQKLSSLLLVEVYVRGQVQLTIGFGSGEAGDPQAGPLYVGRLSALIGPDDYPNLSAALASGSLEDDTDLAVDEFAAGLDILLDGIALRVGRR